MTPAERAANPAIADSSRQWAKQHGIAWSTFNNWKARDEFDRDLDAELERLGRQRQDVTVGTRAEHVRNGLVDPDEVSDAVDDLDAHTLDDKLYDFVDVLLRDARSGNGNAMNNLRQLFGDRILALFAEDDDDMLDKSDGDLVDQMLQVVEPDVIADRLQQAGWQVTVPEPA